MQQRNRVILPVKTFHSKFKLGAKDIDRRQKNNFEILEKTLIKGTLMCDIKTLLKVIKINEYKNLEFVCGLRFCEPNCIKFMQI